VDRSLASAVRTHLALSAVAAAILHAQVGPASAASLVAGTGFALLNLGLWSLLVRGSVYWVTQRGQMRPLWLWLALLAKLLAFALLGAVLLWRVPVEPLSFAAGVALLSVSFLRLTRGIPAVVKTEA